MATPKRESDIKRFEQAIYNSLLIDADPQATIAKLRQQLADGVGSADWQEATKQAIAKFEAR